MTTDFSPSMLRLFLKARVCHMANVAFPAARGSQERAAKAELRKAAGVSKFEFDEAWAGRLKRPTPRLRLWMSFGIDPSVFYIRLTDDGQESIP